MAQNLELVLTDKYMDIVKRADGNGLNQIVIKYLKVSADGGVASPKDKDLAGTTYKIPVDSSKYQGESLISITALDSDDKHDYIVRSIGVFTDHDEMIAVCKIPASNNPKDAIATKTAAADLYLSVDLLIKKGDPRSFKVQGVPWHPALATHVQPGVIRIATEKEALAEAIDDAAITPIVFKTIHDKLKAEVHAEVVKMQKLIDTFKGSLCQPGHIQFWFSKSPPPAHWFDCNGSAFPAKYKDLLKTYPNGKTPNFEGRYPRQGVSQAGTFLDQDIQKHTHTGKVHEAAGYNATTGSFDHGTKATNSTTLNKRFYTSSSGIHSHRYTTVTGGTTWGSDPWSRSPSDSSGERSTNNSPAHTHYVDVNFGGHTHGVAIGAHSHNVPIKAHSHNLTIAHYGGSETRPNSFVGRFIIFGGIPH